jgi:DNA polymerase III epsilon subunit-like protein
MNEFLSIPHDYLIAHNLDFDFNVIVNACLWDLQLPYPRFGRQFCTMKLSTDLLRIPFGNGRSGYKSPKLKELYEYVMNRPVDPTQLHNSLYDTELLVELVNNFRPFRAILGLLGPHEQIVNEGDQRTRTLIL